MINVFTNTLKRIFINPLNVMMLFLFPSIFAFLMFASTNPDKEIPDDPAEISLAFGLVDEDDSLLSQMLREQLETRFRVESVERSAIVSKLTEQDLPWVLLVPDGYGAAIVNGEIPVLEGYSLTLSDVSAMGNANAEAITRSFMLLSTDDESILAKWAEKSVLDVQTVQNRDVNWESVTYWLGFFGFVIILIAYFFAKALSDNKRRGMPDRLGVLPLSPRKLLISGAFAVFAATEITVIMLMAVVFSFLGAVPNMLLLFTIISLYNLFAVSFVLAVISMSKDLGVASVISMLTATILSMLGGLFWPLELVPDFMQRLAWFSPGYWLVSGIGDVQNPCFESFGMSILFLLGFSVVAILFGGWKSVQKMDSE